MKSICMRLIIITIILFLYLFLSIIVIPDSIISMRSAITAIESLINYNNITWYKYFIYGFVSTMVRFIVCAFFVTVCSVLLLIIFYSFYAGRIFLDHFSESFRTIPATAWAFPIAVSPLLWISTSHTLYISTILSTTPILTLGLLKVYMEVRGSISYQIAERNGIKSYKIFNFKFIPWLAFQSIVHFKTTFSLIFIIVIVLESVLQSIKVPYGLGVIMGGLHVSNISNPNKYSAQIFLLIFLMFISITLASLMDLINEYVNYYKKKFKFTNYKL